MRVVNVVLVLFFSAFTVQSVFAETVGDFMATMENGTQAEKEKKLIYFNGALDALMYANGSLFEASGGTKLVCFPSPIPGREALYKEFLAQVKLAVDVAGMKRAAAAQVDQIIFASWMKHYPCET